MAFSCNSLAKSRVIGEEKKKISNDRGRADARVVSAIKMRHSCDIRDSTWHLAVSWMESSCRLQLLLFLFLCF